MQHAHRLTQKADSEDRSQKAKALAAFLYACFNELYIEAFRRTERLKELPSRPLFDDAWSERVIALQISTAANLDKVIDSLWLLEEKDNAMVIAIYGAVSRLNQLCAELSLDTGHEEAKVRRRAVSSVLDALQRDAKRAAELMLTRTPAMLAAVSTSQRSES